MSMGSVGKNMGFICRSRWLDLAITAACVGIAAFAIRGDIDELIAFAIPAGIGVFRQFVPLLSFPYVVSIGIAVILAMDWAGLLPFSLALA